MAITAPIAGAYTGTYDSDPMFYTRQGWKLNFSQKAEKLDESDIYGLSLIEIVYRGCTMTIETDCKVYDDNTVSAFWGWQGTLGQVYDAANPIALLGTTAAKQLVLTAVANTSAEADPATLAALAIISPDQNLQLIFNSTIREVPLRFDVLTTDSTGTGSLFTTT